MSYNPAFVLDESPLAGGQHDSADQSNGIKLTSFKPLPAGGSPAGLEAGSAAASKRGPDKSSGRKSSSKQQGQGHAIKNNLLLTTASSLGLIEPQSSSSLASISPHTTTATRAPTTSATTITTTTTSTSSNSSLPSPNSSFPVKPPVATISGSAAVECRDMRYGLGRGSNHKTILHDINVTVPEGSIYGLLGPSGCGKTTMLRCVVGRIKPKSGQVRVFGYRPNESGSQIPGPAIGYMPQEISVYEDFTINETLTYFGKINKMKQDLIDARIQFLLNFLDLPGKNRLVASLSGGQKRRVSLAAALVHSPPLLILDEPTVGVDPLLRQSIWKHLVTLAQSEKITVVITTHYIEEARQANVVGLMRHGKLLAEDSPDNLMAQHGMDNLENVFLKLCISDSSRKAAKLAGLSYLDVPALSMGHPDKANKDDEQHEQHEQHENNDNNHQHHQHQHHHHHHHHHHQEQGAKHSHQQILLDANGLPIVQRAGSSERVMAKKRRQFPSLFRVADGSGAGAETPKMETSNSPQVAIEVQQRPREDHHNHHQRQQPTGNEIVESASVSSVEMSNCEDSGATSATSSTTSDQHQLTRRLDVARLEGQLAEQPDFVVNRNNLKSMVPGSKYAPKKVSTSTWFKSLLAVIWKNYIRLKRNPPVLIFEFILPAVQVILFCLCIGGDPFDVPLAVVNDELIPQASRFFLDAIDKNAIRQVPFDNLEDAIQSVRRGETWGAIHIPDRYTHFLQERLTHPADITNETLANGTINIYPDLTNLHLALAMENTFREAFIKFARDTLNMFGYEPEAAELPIRVEEPVYGTLKRNGYLEFMAPGVVISITYVMATGLTALAFILEKRDGLLERSLVSGVTTSQILLAHAAVQVVVMIIQISLVLAFTFFVFEIPSHGPFFWVVLLILLQGCTGMGFGLLVSAVCAEENTAVMMLVGTFYTNLILAGIIWPIEAMPRWLRWLSYAQPQTLPTETLRNILSRGWGIGESGVYLGFLVTIGWLVAFLLAAGICMRYK